VVVLRILVEQLVVLHILVGQQVDNLLVVVEDSLELQRVVGNLVNLVVDRLREEDILEHLGVEDKRLQQHN
jgi:hypothetical protein